MTTAWETVIGLEVHVQLATKSKIFSGSPTAYGAAPNTQTNEIDLGLPGTLPMLNKEAVHKAIKFGLAVDAALNSPTVFARKNYFYADLPKGYQISQHDRPIVGPGHVDITLPNDQTKRINITRAHLEEDAGKSIHDLFSNCTAIDLNRAGTPLLEIVSEPDMRSSQEAVAYLKTLHTLVRYLDISDANMQEGSFRCDVNISIRPAGSAELGTKVECKNLNSFRFIEQAIDYEVERQISLLESGQTVAQETRLFDPATGATKAMRSKEDAHDYRYFPDPDLLPVMLTQEDIESAQKALPELPAARKARFMDDYALSLEQSEQLTASKALADYYEQALTTQATPKLVANWLLSELMGYLNKHDLTIDQSPVPPVQLGQLVNRIEDHTLSSKLAKDVLATLWRQDGSDVDAIIDQQGLKQVSDTGELETLVDQVIDANPQQVTQYQAGKTKLIGFFVGQVMKQTGGKANPALVSQLLKAKLD